MLELFAAWSLFGLWAVAQVLLARWRGALLDASLERAAGRRHALELRLAGLAALLLVLLLAPLALGALVLHGLDRVPRHHAAFGLAPPPLFAALPGWAWPSVFLLVTVALPAAAGGLVMQGAEHRWVQRRRLEASRGEAVESGTVVALVLGALPIALLQFWPPLPGELRAASAILALAAMVAVLLLARRGAPRTATESADLDAEFALSPLGRDLEALRARFVAPRRWPRQQPPRWVVDRGVVGRDARVSPERARLMVVSAWWQGFHEARPRVPFSLVRAIPADALVAATALLFARRRRPLARRGWVPDARRLGRGASLLAALFLVTSGTVVGLAFGVAGVGTATCLVAIGAGIALLFLRALAGRGARVYTDAHDAWRSLRPPSPPLADADSAIAFARALLAFDELARPDFDRHQLARLVAANRGLVRALARLGAPPEAFAALLAAWCAEAPPPSPDPPPAGPAAPSPA